MNNLDQPSRENQTPVNLGYLCHCGVMVLDGDRYAVAGGVSHADARNRALRLLGIERNPEDVLTVLSFEMLVSRKGVLVVDYGGEVDKHFTAFNDAVRCHDPSLNVEKKVM